MAICHFGPMSYWYQKTNIFVECTVNNGENTNLQCIGPKWYVFIVWTKMMMDQSDIYPELYIFSKRKIFLVPKTMLTFTHFQLTLHLGSEKLLKIFYWKIQKSVNFHKFFLFGLNKISNTEKFTCWCGFIFLNLIKIPFNYCWSEIECKMKLMNNL